MTHEPQTSHFSFNYINTLFLFMYFLVKQDFLRSSFVTDDTNMVQGPPSASHLEGPHMGVQGGIDLMVHNFVLSATAINTPVYL
jgi:hypothetical protein